jgi:hypothetical protein
MCGCCDITASGQHLRSNHSVTETPVCLNRYLSITWSALSAFSTNNCGLWRNLQPWVLVLESQSVVVSVMTGD